MSDKCVAAVIMPSMICLCAQVLRYFDYFFTTVFTIEIAVKVGALCQNFTAILSSETSCKLNAVV